MVDYFLIMNRKYADSWFGILDWYQSCTSGLHAYNPEQVLEKRVAAVTGNQNFLADFHTRIVRERDVETFDAKQLTRTWMNQMSRSEAPPYNP